MARSYCMDNLDNPIFDARQVESSQPTMSFEQDMYRVMFLSAILWVLMTTKRLLTAGAGLFARADANVVCHQEIYRELMLCCGAIFREEARLIAVSQG